MNVTIPDADARLAETRRIFQRVLSQWASDLLTLQSRGERQPRWVTRAGGHPVVSSNSFGHGQRKAA